MARDVSNKVQLSIWLKTEDEERELISIDLSGVPNYSVGQKIHISEDNFLPENHSFAHMHKNLKSWYEITEVHQFFKSMALNKVPEGLPEELGISKEAAEANDATRYTIRQSLTVELFVKPIEEI